MVPPPSVGGGKPPRAVDHGRHHSGALVMALIDPKRPGPLIGPYPEYTDIMQKTMESTARSGASPEDALNKANEQMNAELEQYYG